MMRDMDSQDKAIGWYKQEMKNEVDPKMKKIYFHHIEFLERIGNASFPLK